MGALRCKRVLKQAGLSRNPRRIVSRRQFRNARCGRLVQGWLFSGRALGTLIFGLATFVIFALAFCHCVSLSGNKSPDFRLRSFARRIAVCCRRCAAHAMPLWQFPHHAIRSPFGGCGENMIFGGDGAKQRIGKPQLVKGHSQSRRKRGSQDQMQETRPAFQKTPCVSEDRFGLSAIQGATPSGNHSSNYSTQGSENKGESALAARTCLRETLNCLAETAD